MEANFGSNAQYARDAHFLSLADATRDRLLSLLELAQDVKASPGQYSVSLSGMTMAMLFEKPSLRTRATFEIGMNQLGGRALYFGPAEVGLGQREAVKDVARNLGRWTDVIMARVFSHRKLEELAIHGSVPVINGLSDFEHPCQALGDFLTLLEHKGRLQGCSLAWVGDGNNVVHSLLFGAAQLGIQVRVATPAGYDPAPQVIRTLEGWGADFLLTSDPGEAVAGADVVYTDVWASMGQEDETEKRREVFRPYQVNADLMKKAGKQALFMHCLPAHRGDEVTDEVIDSPQSVVFDQAENRLHIQKAILLSLLS